MPEPEYYVYIILYIRCIYIIDADFYVDAVYIEGNLFFVFQADRRREKEADSPSPSMRPCFRAPSIF